MRFASLGSGSRGNATLVQSDTTTILVDCGFSLKETLSRLQRLQVTPERLDAILVTHEHTDHCSGVGRLSRRFDIPVYMSRGTHASGRCDDVSLLEYFHSEAPFEIGDIRVEPIAVPHDAREPCQFVLCHGALRLGILTDLGSITSAVVAHYRDCGALLLECNHDTGMLWEGPYPPSLKKRVGGDWGHLNNEQAAQLLLEIGTSGLQHLVVAHISEKNNSIELVQSALDEVLSAPEVITWADQAEGFGWLSLD